MFAHKLAVKTSSGDYGYPDALTTKDTAGTSRTHGGRVFAETEAGAGSALYGVWAFEANNTDSNFGIQVGTETTAPASQDYHIETLIAHGVASGKLYYGACQVAERKTSRCRLSGCLETLVAEHITIREIT